MDHDPSPTDFYFAFRRVVEAQSERPLRDWADDRRCTDEVRKTILPAIAAELNMEFRLECCTLDAAFFPRGSPDPVWARYISVALGHENDRSTAVEEMHKLQLFNTPLTVLITYPERPEFGEKLLTNYGAIIQAADVFGNATTCRRSLVIFGYKGPKWRAFAYGEAGFSSLDAASDQQS